MKSMDSRSNMSECLDFSVNFVVLCLKLSSSVVLFCSGQAFVSEGGDVVICRGIDVFGEFFNPFVDSRSGYYVRCNNH